MFVLQAPLVQCDLSENEGRSLALIVDDKPIMRELLGWMLSFHGYEPVCVANGLEALAWLESASRMGRYPAVILLDLIMPIMDGATFLANMRARWNASTAIPPVILLTVDESSHDDLACDSVLVKPFHISDLGERLQLVTGTANMSF